ncbi:DUF2218 domain-containing protein [Pelagerythrobacter sp.]|uniref:DUF2218 domain-containing protein n=1 Tax=Pelagerythrobacter sp. TaxID=2800702 RepID=UPI0035B2859F
MTSATTASVPTTSGSRYLQQLCKHWSHNLAVDYSADKGTVTFPAEGRSGSWAGDAVLTLDAGPDALECRIDASEPGQRDVLKGVVANHLDRFAFREAPLTFDWRDA